MIRFVELNDLIYFRYTVVMKLICAPSRQPYRPSNAYQGVSAFLASADRDSAQKVMKVQNSRRHGIRKKSKSSGYVESMINNPLLSFAFLGSQFSGLIRRQN